MGPKVIVPFFRVAKKKNMKINVKWIEYNHNKHIPFVTLLQAEILQTEILMKIGHICSRPPSSTELTTPLDIFHKQFFLAKLHYVLLRVEITTSYDVSFPVNKHVLPRAKRLASTS